MLALAEVKIDEMYQEFLELLSLYMIINETSIVFNNKNVSRYPIKWHRVLFTFLESV